jgi:hypothetical protein
MVAGSRRAQAFGLVTADTRYGGGGRAAAGRGMAASPDWLYAFIYDFNGTAVAHGANAAFIGRNLWDIINGSARLRVLVDGRQLHEDFLAAARSGVRAATE